MTDGSPIPPPRIAPLDPAEWSDVAHLALERWRPPMNFHKTMAHNPATLAAWIGFGNHILFDNLLEPRDREIVILRVAASMACEYEWGAHRRFTLAQGLMAPAEVDRLAFAIEPCDWSPQDRVLIAAVDNLNRKGAIGQRAWNALAKSYSPAHFVDLIFLVGEFRMVAMLMKSFRIPLEDGFEPIPTRATPQPEERAP